MMAVYEYTAKDETGSIFSGKYNDIKNATMLRKELAKMDYTFIKAHRLRDPVKRRKKIKQMEVVNFAYKLAGMYSAGLTIISCLETLEKQTENQDFRHIIADIRQNIEAGANLQKAFGKYRNVFSNFFVGMLQAGETGGKLATALEMSAEYLEQQANIKQKVKSAFAYPIVVGIMCFVIVVFLLAFIIPVFSKLYKRLHVPMPGPTQILIDLSYLILNWWWAIIVVGFTAVVLLQRLFKKTYFRARWDVFKLNMPVFAKLNRTVVVSKFTRTFAMLASVGVSLVEALDVASQVANNYKITEIAKELQDSIRTGNPVASSLQSHDIFPPIITQLAASGEEAGALPEMLNKGADFLDKDIDRTIKALLVKIEPAIMVIMGIIVGFILISTYLPMFDYMVYIQ